MCDQYIHLNPYLDLLAPIYETPGAFQWLHTGQALLGGAVPVDLIRNGRAQEVLDVIHRLLDSAYV